MCFKFQQKLYSSKSYLRLFDSVCVFFFFFFFFFFFVPPPHFKALHPVYIRNQVISWLLEPINNIG